jgi:hypothetical protein
VLHTLRNNAILGNMQSGEKLLLRDAVRELRRRLPPGWEASEPTLEAGPSHADAVVELIAPDGRAGSIVLEAKARLDPKGVGALVNARAAMPLRGPLIVVSPYLGEATRTRLRDSGVGFLDLTGNVWIVIAKPGLYIDAQGASENPDREARPARSLRGPKAGRIVRALIDRKQPPGVRELAGLTRINPGYVSRVLAFLDSEALITRVGHGRLQSVDWPSLLRRWAQDAPLESRGEARTFLEPRGLPAIVAQLGRSDERYVATAGLAAVKLAPTAPARLGVFWISDALDAATRLGLRSATTGANVLLVEPSDESVFDGATQRSGVWYAAPSQVAADLLTSPGRSPAEGDELIGWMQANEDTWRR